MRIRNGPATVIRECLPLEMPLERQRSGKAGQARRSESQETTTSPCTPLPRRVCVWDLSGVDTREELIRRAAVPVLRHRRLDDLRLALLLNAVVPGRGRRARPRREGHRQVDHRAGARRSCCPRSPWCRAAGSRCDPAAPDPDCPDGPHAPAAASPVRPARLVELPVGATEDRLVGSLDLERALAAGVTAFEPGLLAARAPRHPLRRRGQPPARPPRRPAARRRRDGRRTTSSARASRSGTPPGSCWSAR